MSSIEQEKLWKSQLESGEFIFPDPGLTFEEYKSLHALSISHSEVFWACAARQLLSWDRPFSSILKGDFMDLGIEWFSDGEVNACVNAVDRHASVDPTRVAIIYEADNAEDSYNVTYGELQAGISQACHWLSGQSYLVPGSVVTIYMPMVPEAIMMMLACARLGLIHNVVFGGFSAEALRERIVDTKSALVVTGDVSFRGNKKIPLLSTVEKAIGGMLLEDGGFIQSVLVFNRTSESAVDKVTALEATKRQYAYNSWIVWWDESISLQSTSYPDYYKASSETPLFTLYTSGSTGKPKGILHTTGGYLTYVAMTLRYIFGVDLHRSPTSRVVFGCMADVGWITGHSYVVYGPLLSGVTTVVFESMPTYPTPNRYWEMIERHRITHLYTAPTVLRALQASSASKEDTSEAGKIISSEQKCTPNKYDLSSLLVLGSVGEPISPVTWQWYFDAVGKSQCQVMDTFWQTETGGICISCLAAENISELSTRANTTKFTSSSVPMQPGFASVPFFGIEPVLINPERPSSVTNYMDLPLAERKNGMFSGVLAFKKPWPGIARNVFNDPSRYRDAYFSVYPGYYFTGDGANIIDGLFQLTGRVDDVLNVSGHRLSTAEIEAAAAKDDAVAEAAVLGQDDVLTGQAICIFVVPSVELTEAISSQSLDLKKSIIDTVRRVIGPIATPKRVLFVKDLPKTRSGKIMRRILRKLLEYGAKAHGSNDTQSSATMLDDIRCQLGDLSTIQSPQIIDDIFSVIMRTP